MGLVVAEKGKCVASVLLLAAGVAMISTSLIFSQKSKAWSSGEEDYVIVLDAGSSHTSLNVFSHPHRTNNSLPLFEVAKTNGHPWADSPDAQSSNGINKFAGNPSQAGASLLPLLDYAVTLIPDHKIKHTPVFLFATAGMRDLTRDDPIAASAVLESVRSVISGTEFLFQPHWARVINGTMEGIYGWIATNYGKGSLLAHPSETVGSLDLGGASTQITFSPGSSAAGESHTICLYGTCHLLYSHSYLGFGENDSFKQLQEELGRGKPAGNISNPCGNVGSELPRIDGGNGFLIGSGDGAQCIQDINSLVLKPNTQGFGLNGTAQDAVPSGKSFYASSGYFYTVSAIAAVSKYNVSTSPSVFQLILAADLLCSASQADLRTDFPSATKYRGLYCFQVSLISQLWQGLDVGAAEGQVTVVSDVNSVPTDWALGAAIWQTSVVPKYKIPILGKASFTALLAVGIICCICAIALAGFALHTVRRKRLASKFLGRDSADQGSSLKEQLI